MRRAHPSRRAGPRVRTDGEITDIVKRRFARSAGRYTVRAALTPGAWKSATAAFQIGFISNSGLSKQSSAQRIGCQAGGFFRFSTNLTPGTWFSIPETGFANESNQAT